MGFNFDKVCVGIGLLSLLHAAYSAAQHRTYLRLTEQEFTLLPLDILLQTLASLVLTCYGLVRVVGVFRDIMASGDLEKKMWENVTNRASFYTFNHRGKQLFSNDS